VTDNVRSGNNSVVMCNNIDSVVIVSDPLS